VVPSTTLPGRFACQQVCMIDPPPPPAKWWHWYRRDQGAAKIVPATRCSHCMCEPLPERPRQLPPSLVLQSAYELPAAALIASDPAYTVGNAGLVQAQVTSL
jgi:hypothetical protein